MKKITFFFFLIFFIYIVSPYYSIYNFYKSVKQSDIEFVSENVNWASLRNGFKKDFKEIVNYIHESGFISMSTPFDSESLDWFDDLNISIIKVASCSVDDWPLLRDICNKNKKIIISTAGATMQGTVRPSGSAREHPVRTGAGFWGE